MASTMLARLLLVAAAAAQAVLGAQECIDSKEPARGQFGTRVTIQGTDLLGGVGGTDIIEVTLADVTAQIANASDEMVVVVAKNGTGSGDIVVTSNTGAQAVRNGGWTYLELGVVDSAAPASGQGGTLVTITGSALLGGGAKATSVTLAGVEVAAIKSHDAKQIVVQAAASGAAKGKVVVVSDTGAIVESLEDDAWTYNTPGAIASVSPAAGQLGTVVTIAGANLHGYGKEVVTATLGSTPADIVSQTGTQLVATVRDVSPGTGAVTLTADTGAVVTKAKAFTYLAKGQVAKLAPAEGQKGTRVAITGKGLRGGGPKVAKVVLAGVAADIVKETDTQVDIIVPGGVTKETSGGVTLTSSSGAVVSAAKAFKYLDPPVVFSVAPRLGRGKARVTIVGSLCAGGSKIAKVTLAGVEAAIQAGSSDCKSVEVIAADFGANKKGDVQLIADTGAVVVDTTGFTYLADGAVQKVTPAAGQGGTNIVLTGTHMLGGGRDTPLVTLAGVGALVTAFKEDEIKITALASAKGALGDVVVTGSSGTVTRLENGWTYSAIASVRATAPRLSAAARHDGGAGVCLRAWRGRAGVWVRL